MKHLYTYSSFLLTCNLFNAVNADDDPAILGEITVVVFFFFQQTT
jgi:hypothetical protein